MSIAKMERFSIRRTIKLNSYRDSSEFKLSNEWEIVCSWADDHCVEIRRNITSEKVAISGILTLKDLSRSYFSVDQKYQLESEQEFARFLKSGHSYTVIYFDNLPRADYRPKYFLHGDINIFNISETGKCKDCDHTKSLVELSNEFESLLDPRTSCFADVKLKCGTESIPAHKNILSVRSSVFAAMFKNPMKESHENEVDIKDMDVPAFRIMLTYIYTGKAPDLTVALASDLLFAADKYQLQDLKRVCCDFLKENLSVQNMLNLLALGDLHSETDLKSCAVNYICNKCTKFSDLEETEEWKTLMKERPALAMEILTSVVKSKDDK